MRGGFGLCAVILTVFSVVCAATDTIPVATLIGYGRGEKDRLGNTVIMSSAGMAVSSLYSWSKNGEVDLYDVSADGYVETRSIVGQVPFGAFGQAIARGRNYIAAGAPAEICHNYKGDRFSDCGAVYIFSTNDTLGSHEAYPTRLVPKEKDYISSEFGRAVVTIRDTLFVGAPGMNEMDGAVLQFVRSGNKWELIETLTGPVKGYAGGFGTTLALNEEDTVLVVGAPNDVCTISGWLASGAVHIFFKGYSNAQWLLEQTLYPNIPAGSIQFGSAIAIHQYEIVVGASNSNGAHAVGAGSAYVYNLVTQTSFSLNAVLLANDGESGDAFGCAVGIDDGVVVIGACLERGKMNSVGQALQVSDGAICGTRSTSDTVCYADVVLSLGERAGAVYVYRLVSGSDTRYSNTAVTKVLAPGEGEGWVFGSAVAAYNGRIVVGAHGAASDVKPEVGGLFDISFVVISSESNTVAAASTLSSSSTIFKGLAYVLLAGVCVVAAIFYFVPFGKSMTLQFRESAAASWITKEAQLQPVAMRQSSPSEHGLLSVSEHGSDVSSRGLQAKKLFSGDVESPVSKASPVCLPVMKSSPPVTGTVEPYGTSFSEFGVVNGSAVPAANAPPNHATTWGVEEYYRAEKSPRENLVKIITSWFI